jgi:hypothetical protein
MRILLLIGSLCELIASLTILMGLNAMAGRKRRSPQRSVPLALLIIGAVLLTVGAIGVA